MELIQEGQETKEEKAEDKELESFLRAWRASSFYAWVHKILADEVEKSHLQEVMMRRFLDGETMDNEEIGQQAKIDLQVRLRLEGIKDVLK